MSGLLVRRGSGIPLDARAREEVARRAVAVVFIGNGLAFASWASRLPAIRDNLGLSPAELGVVLLFLSGGSVTTLPLAGAVVRRIGPARAVQISSLTATVGLVLAGFAPTVWMLALGLLLIGVGTGMWDVSMNVEAAEVERRLGRSIMSRFHAGFSLGTVAGAAIGSLAAAAHVGVDVHLPVVAVIVAVVVVATATRFLPETPVEPATRGGPGRSVDGQDPGRRRSAASAWTEKRTLLIGVLVFSMALAEGSANDWLALALVDGYGASHAVGAVGFGVFLSAMTAVRMAGPSILHRVDNVLVLRVSALLVLIGTAAVVLASVPAGGDGTAPLYAVAAVGAVAWGAGSALGFPMGMTAAAVDPEYSAARVSVVSTIGYTAFLAGPPLLGLVGQHVGVPLSLAGVSVAVLLAFATAGAVRR